MQRELILIIPIYNEADSLEALVGQWGAVLESIETDWEILLLNDGSTDRSAELLADLAAENERLEVINKENEGHGPTILRGYADAVWRAEWVFQTDSDLEVAPSDFPAMWEAREEADLLIGYRYNRSGPRIRALVSGILKIVLRMFYGAKIEDANCPFRLMRTSSLGSILDRIPGNTFAPNPVIVGMATLRKLRILELPVTYTPRSAGEVSIKRWKLLRVSVQSLLQTLLLRRNAL